MTGKIIYHPGPEEDVHNKKYFWHYEFGKERELPIPKLKGYKFVGWYHSDINRQLYRIEKILTNESRVLNLYAKFVKGNKIADIYSTITPKMFENAVEEVQTEFYKKISWYGVTIKDNPDMYYVRYKVGEERELPTPKQKGYKFGGWYKCKRGSKNIEKIDCISSEFHSNITLFAKWLKNGEIVDGYKDVKPADFERADKKYNKIK